MREKVRTNAPEWQALLNNVNTYMGTVNEYDSSPENIALVYLMTGQKRYARAAMRWARVTLQRDVRRDSYLYYGGDMREIATVLNYCEPALKASERAKMIDFLNRWTNEIWFNNQGSGWGLNDPGNNYHMSFLEGTAYAGYTLQKLQHPRAAVYIKILHDRLTRPNGVFNYLNTRVCGGDWHEGVGYGVGSKMRLYSALSVIATMSETNYFTQNRFFPDSILYAFYQLQPGNKYIYPGGDMARNPSMPVSSFERYYMQMVTYFIQNSTTRQYGQWYLENIVPSYNVDFNFLGAYYRDMIFKLSLPSMSPDTLPLMYKTTSTNWINLRSGWGPMRRASALQAIRSSIRAMRISMLALL